MNDRARATEVLKKARAILAERLTEKILEQRDELLDDATGDSYMNEIEALYEQIGLKLSHVGQMLSNLPPEEPIAETHTVSPGHYPESTFTVATDPTPNADAIIQDAIPALVGPIYVTAPALPAPKAKEPVKYRATHSALQAFAAQIQAGDLLAAGRSLATLFDLEEPRAIACAATFAQRVRSEAAFFRKVMELRSELHSSDPKHALLLLLDCFGLSRGESAEILHNLQRRRRAG